MLVVVVAVLGFGAIEFFDKVTEKGYRPATVVGIVACMATPLAAYWAGEQALPLILVLGFVAGGHHASSGRRASSPARCRTWRSPRSGIAWIGFLGSFAALILRYSKGSGFPVAAGIISTTIGTDTLCLLAIGVVANDVGALFVGSAAGKTPVARVDQPQQDRRGVHRRHRVSPSGDGRRRHHRQGRHWNSAGDLIFLGVVIAITAPLGDLTESMFKRNLDIKDFGTLVKGHGGVLDRFDGFLFTLPAVYYLLARAGALGHEVAPAAARLRAARRCETERHVNGACRHRRLVGVDRHADARRRACRSWSLRGRRPRRRVVRRRRSIAQAHEFRPKVVAVADPAQRAEVAAALPFAEVVADLADLADDADVVVNAVVGFAGLAVTVRTLQPGKRLALANKESLIAAGPVVQPLRVDARRRAGARRQRALRGPPVPARRVDRRP